MMKPQVILVVIINILFLGISLKASGEDHKRKLELEAEAFSKKHKVLNTSEEIIQVQSEDGQLFMVPAIVLEGSKVIKRALESCFNEAQQKKYIFRDLTGCEIGFLIKILEDIYSIKANKRAHRDDKTRQCELLLQAYLRTFEVLQDHLQELLKWYRIADQYVIPDLLQACLCYLADTLEHGIDEYDYSEVLNVLSADHYKQLKRLLVLRNIHVFRMLYIKEKRKNEDCCNNGIACFKNIFSGKESFWDLLDLDKISFLVNHAISEDGTKIVLVSTSNVDDIEYGYHFTLFWNTPGHHYMRNEPKDIGTLERSDNIIAQVLFNKDGSKIAVVFTAEAKKNIMLFSIQYPDDKHIFSILQHVKVEHLPYTTLDELYNDSLLGFRKNGFVDATEHCSIDQIISIIRRYRSLEGFRKGKRVLQKHIKKLLREQKAALQQFIQVK
jgi:hypothetical protein